MQTTLLQLSDELPLSCSRKGTCCHGNQVFLNPWELACLAGEKQMSVREFINSHCDFGGILLKFDGAKDHRSKRACGLYVENFGCSVHVARPLACRLFPLGRQVQFETANYFYQGKQFPCFDGCPEVEKLPKLSVEDYLIGQETAPFELAQDLYLEIMQNLADISFELLLETGLSYTERSSTLKQWQLSGKLAPTQLMQEIQADWLEALLMPTFVGPIDDVDSFASQHNQLLQEKAQHMFGQLTQSEKVQTASILMMRLALYLATAIGANPSVLATHWVEIAKENGALSND